MNELEAREVDFRMDIVGDGRAAAWLERETSRHHGRVRFWGWLQPVEVRRRLVELDVFLLLSDVEGLPVALLEAMGHAVVPVVSRTRSGSPQLIKNGENGFLLPVGDVQAFAERLEALAADSDAVQKLREAAWLTGQRYSVDRMARSWLSCLGGGQPGRVRAPRPPGQFPVMPSCRSVYPRWLRRLKRRLLGTPGAIS